MSFESAQEEGTSWSEEKYKKGLTQVQEGHPATWGGVIKDTAKLDRTFVTHTLPDIAQNTRIIGVCGIPEAEASPIEDGWFFSDFFLFNHLLKGEGVYQLWISSEGTEPSQLMKRFGQEFAPGYLHGDPSITRKVVLSKDLLAKKALTRVRTFAAWELLLKFLELLKIQCDIAREQGQPVLILVFGHGNLDDKGIHIGSPLGLFTDRPYYLNYSNLKNAIGQDVQVTLLSTSCYSGGWSVNPDLNITMLTAAAPDVQSESWGGSASLGRRSGSIFASAVQQALSSESSPLLADTPIRIPREFQPRQIEAFSEFTRVIHAVLFKRGDRFAYAHGIMFSAQDDDWEASWSKRTGISLTNFQQKLDNLPDYPAPPMGPLGNVTSRNPDEHSEVDPEAARRYIAQTMGFGAVMQQDPLKGAFGGTIRSWQKYVKVLAQDYMSSFPGGDGKGPNTLLHGRINRLLKDPDKASADHLRDIQYKIGYQTASMLTAEDFLNYAEIPLPGKKRGHEFNEEAWHIWAEKNDLLSQFCEILDVVNTAKLFSPPTKEQGPSWAKPTIYIAAALTLANPPSLNAVRKKLEIICRFKDETIKNDIAAAVKSNSIYESGKNWFGSIGATLR